MTLKEQLRPLAAFQEGVLRIWLILYQVFLQPLLFHLNIIQLTDPTYGRADLPHSDTARKLIYDNPDVKASVGRAVLKGEAMRKGGSWDRAGTSWVQYYVWEMANPDQQLDADLIVCHGLNDHAHKLCPHSLRFMKAGFRVIAIDLPSFGKSTGLHAYLPSMRLLVEAVHAVICKVREEDDAASRQKTRKRRRKLFIEGHSMGGFTALYYAALYPPDAQGTISTRPQLDGVAVAAPMLAISSESRPNSAVELLARAIAFFAGRLPLASAVRGNVSDDPRVEEEHLLDPVAYQGRLRIATGLAVLAGLTDLQKLAPSIKVPCYFAHGSKDRTTNWKGTAAFYDKISSEDKTLKIWDDYEHVMMKHVVSNGGMTEADKAKSAAVLEEITEWLLTHAKS